MRRQALDFRLAGPHPGRGWALIAGRRRDVSRSTAGDNRTSLGNS